MVFIGSTLLREANHKQSSIGVTNFPLTMRGAQVQAGGKRF